MCHRVFLVRFTGLNGKVKRQILYLRLCGLKFFDRAACGKRHHRAVIEHSRRTDIPYIENILMPCLDSCYFLDMRLELLVVLPV